jgi:hypothetical protein
LPSTASATAAGSGPILIAGMALDRYRLAFHILRLRPRLVVGQRRPVARA